jgi:hypothetical protein
VTPTLSVDAVHDNDTDDAVDPVTTRPDGTDGDSVSAGGTGGGVHTDVVTLSESGPERTPIVL